MTIHQSAEDYLEQIIMLLETKGYARSVDIAEALNGAYDYYVNIGD